MRAYAVGSWLDPSGENIWGSWFLFLDNWTIIDNRYSTSRYETSMFPRFEHIPLDRKENGWRILIKQFDARYFSILVANVLGINCTLVLLNRCELMLHWSFDYQRCLVSMIRVVQIHNNIFIFMIMHPHRNASIDVLSFEFYSLRFMLDNFGGRQSQWK